MTATAAALATSAAPRAARRVGQEWRRLCAATVAPARFDPGLVADLPEPARRWLNHVIAPGTPLWRSVEVAMAGQIRIGRWRPFTATQVVAFPEGYIWAATARVFGLPVTGYDRLSGGTGEMRWRLLDLVPVVNAAGPEIARSAAGRLASELVLVPTAFTSAIWTEGSAPDVAVATWQRDDDQDRVELRVGPDGRLLDVLIQRWGSPPGEVFGRYPFGCTVEAERRHAGVILPSVFRAGWWWGTARQAEGEFFRAEITAVTFR